MSLPRSRVPDPRTAPVLRWGFVGTGFAAQLFANDLRTHTDQRLVTCFSRTAERADEFARQWEFARVARSLDEVLADPEVDVVYVATPHNEHHDQALRSIAAGKPVLVEKAFTQTAWQAAEVVEAAAAAGVACMEAMWTRFLPRHDIVRQVLAEGLLGELEVVTADHGQYFAPDANHRLYDPDRAGGAVLDLGVYPVSWAHFVLGAPGRVTGVGALAFTGVDRQVTGVLDEYASAPGAQAVVHTTLAARTPVRAVVAGTQGRLELDHFYGPGQVTVVPREGETQHTALHGWEASAGLALQACHFAELVSQGALESPLMPWAESVAVVETMDELRRQVGCELPGDERPVSRRDLLGL